MPDEVKHVNLRLPLDVHAAAVKLAEQEDRSLNKLIIRLIRDQSARVPLHLRAERPDVKS